VTLSAKRQQFAKMKCLLEHYIEFLGLHYAEDQGKRCNDCPVGHPRSTHKVGLAMDILIYSPTNHYPHPNAKTIYSLLHDFWDFIGGAERIEDDLNHFSLEWEGVR
jgi:hypothetical protein